MPIPLAGAVERTWSKRVAAASLYEQLLQCRQKLFLLKQKFGKLLDWLPTRVPNSDSKIGQKIGAAAEPKISDNFN